MYFGDPGSRMFTIAGSGLVTALAMAAMLAASAMPAVSAAAPAGGYTLVAKIKLPGDKGGHGDWVAFDPATNAVWLSQSPDHAVVVIDAKTNAVKRVLSGIASGNVVAMSPRYAFVSDADGNDVAVFDKASFARVATLQPGGKTPDGLVYDPAGSKLFVTSDDSNDIAVFDATPPFARRGGFKLQPAGAKDGPDVPALVSGKLLQPDDNVIDVIDAGAEKLVGVWHPPVKGDAKPMVFDAKTGHIFMGTTDKAMLVLDATTGDRIASIPLRGSVDETAIDPGARRAFAGDKAGIVEVIDLDAMKVVDAIPSEKNAHTLDVDPASHHVFVYLGDSNAVEVYAPATATATATAP